MSKWTDPLLIGWALTVESTSNVGVLRDQQHHRGFIVRPPQTRVRRVLEAAVVVGCITAQVSVASRDTLWSLVGSGPLESVPLSLAEEQAVRHLHHENTTTWPLPSPAVAPLSVLDSAEDDDKDPQDGCYDPMVEPPTSTGHGVDFGDDIAY